MLSTWIHSDGSLVTVVKGIMEALTEGNLSGRTKFDIWRCNDEKYRLAIWVSSEEKDLIVTKAGVPHEIAIQGPGNLFANELPNVVILRQVVPRILLTMSLSKDTVSADEQTRAFMLLSYNVGLG